MTLETILEPWRLRRARRTDRSLRRTERACRDLDLSDHLMRDVGLWNGPYNPRR